MTESANIIRLQIDPIFYSSDMEEEIFYETMHRVDGLLAFERGDGLFYKPAVDGTALAFLMTLAQKWNLPMPQFQAFDEGPHAAYLRYHKQPWLARMFPHEDPVRTIEEISSEPELPGWEYLGDLEHDEPCHHDGFTAKPEYVETALKSGYRNTNGDFWVPGPYQRMYGGNHWGVYPGGPAALTYYNHYREPFPLPWMLADPNIVDRAWERVMFASALDEMAFFHTLHSIDGVIGIYGEGPCVHILQHRRFFTDISERHLQSVAWRYQVAS